MKNTWLALLFFPAFCAGQQLPYHSPLAEGAGFLWNPGMTAASDNLEYGAWFRRQWFGFSGAPRTAAAFIQYPFVEQNMGVGGYLLTDKAGAMTFNQLGISYAYRFRPGISGDDQLSVGINATLGQLFFDGQTAILHDEDDDLVIRSEGSGIFPNAGAGFFYTSVEGSDYDEPHFFAGAAVQQLMPNQVSVEEDSKESRFGREMHWHGTLGARLGQDFIAVEPSLWVHVAAPNAVNVALNLKIEMEDAFWAGISYATDQTVFVHGGAIFKNDFLKDGQLRVGALGTFYAGNLAK